MFIVTLEIPLEAIRTRMRCRTVVQRLEHRLYGLARRRLLPRDRVRLVVSGMAGREMNHQHHGLGRTCVAVLMLVLGLLSGCSRTAPEQALRNTIATLQSSIEQRDGSALQKLLADDFIGPDGLDRDGARRTAQLMFLRYPDVGVSLGPLEVDLKEEYATVRFSAVLTGGAGVLPASGQLYDVETGWRLVDGEWRLVNANWKPRL